MAHMLEATIEQNLADIKLHLDSFKGSINMGPFFILKQNKSLKLDLVNLIPILTN